MKFFSLLLAVLLGVALGAVSVSRIQAQTAAPASARCPGQGMTDTDMMGRGMMMQGMHGPADRAYMQSMMTVHQGMRAHAFTGNADHDFMVMMIPHQQAAIGMAKTELAYGKNPKLRKMAQAIVAARQAELDQMKALFR